MKTIKIKLSRFKGHWIVPVERKDEFIKVALGVPKNPEYGLHIFEDFKMVLLPIARYVSAADEAHNVSIWYSNIPEFGYSSATGNEIDVVIKIE